jgi:hypothetical protein
MREKPRVITSVRKPSTYEREVAEMRRSQMKLLWFFYGITTAILAWIWSQI